MAKTKGKKKNLEIVGIEKIPTKHSKRRGRPSRTYARKVEKTISVINGPSRTLRRLARYEF